MSVCYYVLNYLIGCKIAKAEMTHFQRHCLLVNIPFTKEDKILIKNLFELKGYTARQRVFQKKLKCQQHLKVVAFAMDYWLVDRHPGSADDATPTLILLMNWCYTKNG